MKTLLSLPLALLPLLAGCHQPDPVVECARMEADVKALVERSTKPPRGLDPIGERNFYRSDKGDISLDLLIVTDPYEASLNTRDPFTFCEALTGRRALPSAVPNPYQ